jgi:hypothetical protein
VLSDEQRGELVTWLRDQENIPAEPQEIVATGKTLDYYVGCWGTAQKTAATGAGTALSIWQGEGYFFLIADYGDFRAAAVF